MSSPPASIISPAGPGCQWQTSCVGGSSSQLLDGAAAIERAEEQSGGVGAVDVECGVTLILGRGEDGGESVGQDLRNGAASCSHLWTPGDGVDKCGGDRPDVVELELAGDGGQLGAQPFAHRFCRGGEEGHGHGGHGSGKQLSGPRPVPVDGGPSNPRQVTAVLGQHELGLVRVDGWGEVAQLAWQAAAAASRSALATRAEWQNRTRTPPSALWPCATTELGRRGCRPAPEAAPPAAIAGAPDAPSREPYLIAAVQVGPHGSAGLPAGWRLPCRLVEVPSIKRGRSVVAAGHQPTRVGSAANAAPPEHCSTPGTVMT